MTPTESHAVPKQVPSTPVRHHKTTERDYREENRVGLVPYVQQTALDEVTKAFTNTQVLRYCNPEEETTLVCDTSQFQLGGALM